MRFFFFFFWRIFFFYSFMFCFLSTMRATIPIKWKRFPTALTRRIQSKITVRTIRKMRIDFFLTLWTRNYCMSNCFRKNIKIFFYFFIIFFSYCSTRTDKKVNKDSEWGKNKDKKKRNNLVKNAIRSISNILINPNNKRNPNKKKVKNQKF